MKRRKIKTGDHMRVFVPMYQPEATDAEQDAAKTHLKKMLRNKSGDFGNPHLVDVQPLHDDSWLAIYDATYRSLKG